MLNLFELYFIESSETGDYKRPGNVHSYFTAPLCECLVLQFKDDYFTHYFYNIHLFKLLFPIINRFQRIRYYLLIIGLL